MDDLHVLMAEAEALGLNASMYLLLPADKRVDGIKKDIAREKKRLEELKNGQIE